MGGIIKLLSEERRRMNLWQKKEIIIWLLYEIIDFNWLTEEIIIWKHLILSKLE